MIHVACNLCGRDEWQIHLPSTMNGSELNVDSFRCTNLGYGHHAQIVTCCNCGLIYANPRWSAEALMAAYKAVEDETYLQEREGRVITFRRHLHHLQTVVGSANGRSLLDVGAYVGVFVEMALAAGWDAVGIEPSSWAAAEARKRGLPVYQGTQFAPELAQRRFDVITMWDVIEHLDDPSANIKQSFQLLKPGGWLVLHTMDVDSLMARLLKGRWPWYMDMHLYYFSQKTLAEMLRQQGFQVKWTGIQGRYISLGYLATRIGGMNRASGRFLSRLFRLLRIEAQAIPVNFGDLFTVYARRPA